jgi:hypothetical protein
MASAGAHTSNPSRDREDHGSKLAQVNSLRDPISKKPFQKKKKKIFLDVEC